MPNNKYLRFIIPPILFIFTLLYLNHFHIPENFMQIFSKSAVGDIVKLSSLITIIGFIIISFGYIIGGLSNIAINAIGDFIISDDTKEIIQSKFFVSDDKELEKFEVETFFTFHIIAKKSEKLKTLCATIWSNLYISSNCFFSLLLAILVYHLHGAFRTMKAFFLDNMYLWDKEAFNYYILLLLLGAVIIISIIFIVLCKSKKLFKHYKYLFFFFLFIISSIVCFIYKFNRHSFVMILLLLFFINATICFFRYQGLISHLVRVKEFTLEETQDS